MDSHHQLWMYFKGASLLSIVILVNLTLANFTLWMAIFPCDHQRCATAASLVAQPVRNTLREGVQPWPRRLTTVFLDSWGQRSDELNRSYSCQPGVSWEDAVLQCWPSCCQFIVRWSRRVGFIGGNVGKLPKSVCGHYLTLLLREWKLKYSFLFLNLFQIRAQRNSCIFTCWIGWFQFVAIEITTTMERTVCGWTFRFLLLAFQPLASESFI